MFGRSLSGLLFAGGLAVALVNPRPARTQTEAPAPPAGMEILARGPVHEAYAQPTDSNVQPTPVIQREPPTAIEEQPPDQKPEGDVVWIPGYWQWDEDRSDFVWVSGFWRVPPPGRQWVPGSYRKTDEGYQWVPGFWMSEKQDSLSLLPPPPAPVETGPSQPAPSEDSIYVPGCWVYRESRYLWRPGYYLDCRPDLVWCPARYVWTPAGYLFVDGFWDLPLGRRGLLFAPVGFTVALYRQPSFSYTPCYVVNADFLQTALFVRPVCGHYYFGDYYSAAFVRAGFIPWCDFRIGRGCYDPLYAHCRACYGSTWAKGIYNLYVGRYSGTAPLPPRTLVQQTTLIGKGVNVTNVRNVTVLSPLGQAQGQGVRLTTLSQGQRSGFQQNAQQVRSLGQQRGALENRVLAANAAPLRASDPPRTVRLSGLRTRDAAPTRNGIAPPAAPVQNNSGRAVPRTPKATALPAPNGQTPAPPHVHGHQSPAAPRHETPHTAPTPTPVHRNGDAPPLHQHQHLVHPAAPTQLPSISSSPVPATHHPVPTPPAQNSVPNALPVHGAPAHGAGPATSRPAPSQHRHSGSSNSHKPHHQ